MSRGYTILESLIVLTILCVTMCMSIPILSYDVSLIGFENLFTSDLVCLQQQAYLHNESHEIEVFSDLIVAKHEIYGNFDGIGFKVTKLGRVSKAVTIYASTYKKYLELKVWLGMGRVHVEG